MRILHISAECYPAAKAGGLGDVVGALPKYLSKAGTETGVVLPKYHTKWILNQSFETVYQGVFYLHQEPVPFSIEREVTEVLGFPFFVANIPGKFDRPGVYMDEHNQPYSDELRRSLSFQLAVLEWIKSMEKRPSLLHCHDHHTALIPFFINHAHAYQELRMLPTVFTIHNGEYHGSFGWENLYLFPPYDMTMSGLLDWNKAINPLATAIKCCWKLTTVSPSYMQELQQSSNGLEGLLRNEASKSQGILNGIDVQVWNPKTDKYLPHPLKRSVDKYKAENKAVLRERFNINEGLPIVTFIGRLVGEKGADIIPHVVQLFMQTDPKMGFVVLGTGEPRLHHAFTLLKQQFPGFFDVALEYNEGLAHTLYAGSDFLFMPSRVEPCGLNQMYGLRYGTIPIVRSVGGLRDTITDMSEEQGSGYRFDHFNVHEANHALKRAAFLYEDQKAFKAVRKHIMSLDFSWERSAATYQEIYESLIS
ncbi:MAG: glycogen/starch synthase [Bacteroidota bacterium]